MKVSRSSKQEDFMSKVGVLEELARYENARIVFRNEEKFRDGTVIVVRGFIEGPEEVLVFGFENGGDYRALSRAIVNKKEINPVRAELDKEGNVVLLPPPLPDDDEY